MGPLRWVWIPEPDDALVSVHIGAPFLRLLRGGGAQRSTEDDLRCPTSEARKVGWNDYIQVSMCSVLKPRRKHTCTRTCTDVERLPLVEL